MQQNLILNIIPFTPPVQQVTFPFYKVYKEGDCPVYIDRELTGLLDDKMSKLEQGDLQWLYTDFKEPKEDAIVLTIDLTTHTDFANHYYRHLIFNYFRNGVAHIMHRNFIKEIEVWFLNENSKAAKYNVYNQFTIKVQHNKVTSGPELVLSYDGHTKVYKQSLAELVGFPTDNFNWLNCNGILHKWKYLPDESKLNLDKVFPVVSNKMKPQLGIAFDVPDLTNRYPKYYKALNDFYNKYLNTDCFRLVIPIADTGFINIDDHAELISGDATNYSLVKALALSQKQTSRDSDLINLFLRQKM